MESLLPIRIKEKHRCHQKMQQKPARYAVRQQAEAEKRMTEGGFTLVEPRKSSKKRRAEEELSAAKQGQQKLRAAKKPRRPTRLSQKESGQQELQIGPAGRATSVSTVERVPTAMDIHSLVADAALPPSTQ